MKNYEFWFVVGSQTLYGEEVLHRRCPRRGNGAESFLPFCPIP